MSCTRTLMSMVLVCSVLVRCDGKASRPGQECDASACPGDDDGGDDDIIPSAVCGDGVVGGEEQCDDGAGNSDSAADACRSDCRPHYCGDGIRDSDEQCDPAAGDGTTCTPTCISPFSVTYADPLSVYAVGRPTVANTAVTTASGSLSFSIAPALPPGLSLDTATGTVSGTPALPAPLTEHIVTVTASSGVVAVTLRVGVYDFDAVQMLSLPHDVPGFAALAHDAVTSLAYDGATLFAGTYGGLSATADSGATWTTWTPRHGLMSSVIADVAVAGTVIYAATPAGLAVSSDGETFTMRGSAAGLPDPPMVAHVAVGGGAVYAVSNRLFVSDDGGASFEDIGLNASAIFDLSATPTLICVATPDGIAVSADGGTSFPLKSPDINPGDLATAVYCDAENDKIYVATLASGLAISENGGDDYSAKTTANGLCDNYVVAIYAAGDAVFATHVLGFSESANGGASFTCNPTLISFGRAILGAGALRVIGTDTGLHLSTTSGSSFSERNAVGVPWLVSFQPLAVEDASIIIGSSNSVFRSTNSGGAFAQFLNGPTMGTAIAEVGQTIVVGTSSGIYVSQNDAESFDQRTTAAGLGSNVVRDVAIADGAIYVATSGGLSVSEDGGTSFVNRTSVDGLTADSVVSLAAHDANVYAVTTAAGLSVSADGGTTFETRTTGHGLAADDVYVVRVSRGGVVYAGAWTPVVSVSTDHGASFEQRRRGLPDSASPITAIAAEASFIAVGVEHEGLYVSLDSGANFWRVAGHGGHTMADLAWAGGVLYLTTQGEGSDGWIYKSAAPFAP